MATERQITANRRNARRSTGPRSRAGKKRASRNSYRHGLSSGVATSAEFAKHVESLARKIACCGADAVSLEVARAVARAEFELAQIRRVRVALIARMAEFGELEVPDPLRTCRDVIRSLTSIDRADPAIYRRRQACLVQNRSAQLKPYAGRFRNYSSLIVTSDAPPPGAIVPRVISLLEKCRRTISS